MFPRPRIVLQRLGEPERAIEVDSGGGAAQRPRMDPIRARLQLERHRRADHGSIVASPNSWYRGFTETGTGGGGSP